MAVEFNGLKMLLWAKSLGASFETTLTLGRQGFVCSPRRFRRALRDFGFASNNEDIDRCFKRAPLQPLYADELFRFLGAKELISVDRSDFEGATFLHDLNEPFPEKQRGHFDFVFDGGTLEHVFNYPTALRNCLELVSLGGHFLSISPAHNLMGHGFYQISPELLFRVFSAQNGFVLRKIVLHDALASDAAFFQVNDPAVAGKRTALVNSRAMYVAALAQRIDLSPIFATPPQQSDYSAVWEKHDKMAAAQPSSALPSRLRRLRTTLNPYWPYWLLHLKRRLIYYWQRKVPRLSNREHFRKLKRKEICRQ